MRATLAGASDFAAARAGLLELAARWTPDALAGPLGEALELASWQGRDAVFLDDEGVQFAYDAVQQSFREQIDFLRQKRVMPTRSWLDALRGVHDRSFVIAGATDQSMLAEFQAALIEAAENGGYLKDFEKDFDRIVEKYGWEYRGERNWRIRTIFETNMRTSFMAGRLRQMRDPDVVKMRPYWQYLHADRRVPKVPRPLHLSWNNLILMWDDPWWNTHFPPNDWLCSCGVRTLSKRSLEKMGKTGPDEAPKDVLMPVIDKATGQMVMQPRGIGMGWDYMPGDLWERGLVPSRLIDEAGGLLHGAPHRVEIDTPEPMADLLSKAKPFAAKTLADGLPDEDYVRAFLAPFGADLGKAVLWQDKTGTRLPISEELFRARSGAWTIGTSGQPGLSPLLAEALRDPDEIWLGVAGKADPVNRDKTELFLDRRYIRAAPDLGLIIVMEMGQRWWQMRTAAPAADLTALDQMRGGKLLWKRKG